MTVEIRKVNTGVVYWDVMLGDSRIERCNYKYEAEARRKEYQKMLDERGMVLEMQGILEGRGNV